MNNLLPVLGFAVSVGLTASGCAAGKHAVPKEDRLALDNGVPMVDNTRLVFSNVDSVVKGEQQADISRTASLKVTNVSSKDVDIDHILLTGPFALLDPTQAAGLTLDAGSTLEIGVEFVPDQGKERVEHGTLDLRSADATPNIIKLSGFTQPVLEHGTEPNVDQIVEVFGFGTDLSTLAQSNGDAEAVGDEVISAYWTLADPSQSASVLQIAAYTGPRDYQFGFYPHAPGVTDRHQLQLKPLVTRSPTDGQTLLPTDFIDGQDSQQLAYTTFTPQGVFGLYIEWLEESRIDYTDPLYQTQDKNDKGNRALPGGDILIRTFKVRDAQGNEVPNTYLVFQDYQAVNFDWNDNVYIVSNIRPATPDKP